MVFCLSLCRRHRKKAPEENGVRCIFSFNVFQMLLFCCVLWHLTVGSGSPDDLNPLLSCFFFVFFFFVEYWRMWPECVSAVRLRVVVECFVYDIMVVG